MTRGERAVDDSALERVAGHLRMALNMMAMDAGRPQREAGGQEGIGASD